jgi:hypothetical protein
MVCTSSCRAPDRKISVNRSSMPLGWRREKSSLSSFMAYRSPGEVLAGSVIRLDTQPISPRHHAFSRVTRRRCRKLVVRVSQSEWGRGAGVPCGCAVARMAAWRPGFPSNCLTLATSVRAKLGFPGATGKYLGSHFQTETRALSRDRTLP